MKNTMCCYVRTCLTWWVPGAVFVTQWKSVKLFSDVLSNAAQMFLHNKYIGIFSKENKYKSYSLIVVPLQPRMCFLLLCHVSVFS